MATATPTTLPASVRAGVMARAWVMFRERYDYPRMPFRSIGARCYASCLKAAWHEAKEAARLAAQGVTALTASLAALTTPAHRVGLSTGYVETLQQQTARLHQQRVLGAALNLAVAA